MTLLAHDLTLGYHADPVIAGLRLEVPENRVTAIVGPNGCGKSTLLRGLARLLRPVAGAVLLDGDPIHRLPTRAVARILGLLPQHPIAPQGITVAELVARGRHPHQGVFRRRTRSDAEAVAAALTATHTLDLADRAVDELSGGQRQRVWIAMALAQQTRILLLDEPTTYLDIAHQIEMLDLIDELNEARGTTVVMVLHDLNLAARYADHLVALRSGRIACAGPPREIVTTAMVQEVFGLAATVMSDPVSAAPLVIPAAGRRTAPKPAT